MNTHRCARRDEQIGADKHFPGPDSFRVNRDGVETCSYCGSISPEAFFAAVEAGAEVGPTDKSYKVYIDLPHPKVGLPCVKASSTHPHRDWVQVTAENIDTLPLDEYQRQHYLGKYVEVTVEGQKYHGKFYFQHLSPEEQTRFIELYNAKRMNVGIPGYFYTTPFFCRRIVDASTQAPDDGA